MTPNPPERRTTSAARLAEVLARLPTGYSLIPSQIYHYYVMGQDGHNKGYVTEGGEVQWWAGSVRPCPGSVPAATRGVRPAQLDTGITDNPQPYEEQL